jgi:23S rRNA (uracil1939-C5)-methyltransferase
MNNNLIFKGTVISLARGGEGIVQNGDLFYFVKGTLPQDEIVYQINENTKNASLLDIEKPSAFRIKPRCSFFGKCGGCTLQHLEYKTELAEKQKILASLLTRKAYLKIIPEIKIVSGSDYEYRERFQFHRGADYGIGFMENGSNSIININDCPIASPIIRNALQNNKIKCPLDKDRFTVYGKKDLLLCEGANEKGITNILDKKIIVDASVFFQSNSALLEKLITQIINIAKECADKNLPAGDFYCGSGIFSVFLQDIFNKLTLLEENKKSISIAKENLKLNLTCETNKINFSNFTDNQWVKMQNNKTQYGFIAVDPAREGLSQLMRKWLCENKPPVLVYISCSASSLARDSGELIKAGFKLESLTIYDFYPHSLHIETLAVFVSGKHQVLA